MARAIREIYDNITSAFVNDGVIATAYGLDAGRTFNQQFSQASLEAVVFWIVATAIWSMEVLFGIHRQEVMDVIARLKPHTLRWYRDKALRFQVGRALVPDTDRFDNTGMTDDEIAGLEIVRQAAAVEQEDAYGRRFLRVKVAGGADNDLHQLTELERSAVESYLQQVKDAGVLLIVTTGDPDRLYGELIIHYNPTVLGQDGTPLLGGDEPVGVAINDYLQNLTFNGEFSVMRMIDAIQKAPGVELANTLTVKTVTTTNETRVIVDRATPDSGYMRVFDKEDMRITYIPYL